MPSIRSAAGLAVLVTDTETPSLSCTGAACLRPAPTPRDLALFHVRAPLACALLQRRALSPYFMYGRRWPAPCSNAA